MILWRWPSGSGAAVQDRFLLYRDMSGASLHRRGYRGAMHRAALNEAAAAGVLHLAAWPAAVAADSSALPMRPRIHVLVMPAMKCRGISHRGGPGWAHILWFQAY